MDVAVHVPLNCKPPLSVAPQVVPVRKPVKVPLPKVLRDAFEIA